MVLLRTGVTRTSPWLGLVGWIALSALTGVVGAIASVDAREFYAQLEQPSWSPPASVFGPVWTTLYLLMGISSSLVWRTRGWEGARSALLLFIAQLAFNALWSWVFFVWHRGALAVANILVLDVLIVMTLIAFARIRPLASALLAPYLAWVLFATALTIAVWRLNPTTL
jgi:tryptophan-rich sensory protein